MPESAPNSPAGHSLSALGWNTSWAALFEPHLAAGLQPARVSVENKHFFVVCTADAELVAEATGKLLHETADRSRLPKVGDWVAVSVHPGEAKAAIHALLPRRSKLSRKVPGRRVEEQIIASNVDLVFVVQGLDDNFNLRRLERYLVMIRESGARPVVVLNKTDLCADAKTRCSEVSATVGEAPILAVSALTGEGLPALAGRITPGITVAFIGSSGVGKSTLINRLLGEEIQATIEVREGDAKGRHATTRRELFVLPGGGLVIDTPGMREFHLWLAEGSLPDAFADIEALALNCRFTNCGHKQEENCAVLEAVQRGELAPERFQSFLKLRGELAQVEEARRVSELERKRRQRVAQRAFNQIQRDAREPDEE